MHGLVQKGRQAAFFWKIYARHQAALSLRWHGVDLSKIRGIERTCEELPDRKNATKVCMDVTNFETLCPLRAKNEPLCPRRTIKTFVLAAQKSNTCMLATRSNPFVLAAQLCKSRLPKRRQRSFSRVRLDLTTLGRKECPQIGLGLRRTGGRKYNALQGQACSRCVYQRHML